MRWGAVHGSYLGWRVDEEGSAVDRLTSSVLGRWRGLVERFIYGCGTVELNREILPSIV